MEGRNWVTVMKKAIIPLVFMMFFSPFGHAQTLIYSWRDRAGKIHIVDELTRYPSNIGRI